MGEPAGFVTRSIAMVIDLAVVVVMVAIIGSLPQVVSLLLPRQAWVKDIVGTAISVVIVNLPLLYFFVATGIVGRTVGKEVMGLKVVRQDGSRLSFLRSLLRLFGYVVSLVPLGAGFLWIIVDRDRRGWHDHIAGSKVVHVKSPRPTP